MFLRMKGEIIDDYDRKIGVNQDCCRKFRMYKLFWREGIREEMVFYLRVGKWLGVG